MTSGLVNVNVFPSITAHENVAAITIRVQSLRGMFVLFAKIQVSLLQTLPQRLHQQPRHKNKIIVVNIYTEILLCLFMHCIGQILPWTDRLPQQLDWMTQVRKVINITMAATRQDHHGGAPDHPLTYSHADDPRPGLLFISCYLNIFIPGFLDVHTCSASLISSGSSIISRVTPLRGIVNHVPRLSKRV